MNEKVYGMADLSLEEEMKLSHEERLTRTAKMEMINRAWAIRQLADQIELRAKGIPVESDPKHAEAVQEMKRLVEFADSAMMKAALFGIS